MEESVNIAHQKAKEGDVVALSPACASFDAYPNFAARGNDFKKIRKQSFNIFIVASKQYFVMLACKLLFTLKGGKKFLNISEVLCELSNAVSVGDICLADIKAKRNFWVNSARSKHCKTEQYTESSTAAQSIPF